MIVKNFIKKIMLTYVLPFLSLQKTAAPEDINSFTPSSHPFLHAMSNGVSPNKIKINKIIIH